MPAGQAVGLDLQTRSRAAALAEMASWIGNSDDVKLLASAGVQLDSAVRRCNAYRWTFCRRRQTITLQDNIREYPLDSVFRSQLGATITDDQGRPTAPLPFKPYQDYLKDYPMAEASTETGTPTLYTVRAPESDIVLRVAPMPVTGNGAGKLIMLDYHTVIRFASDPSEQLQVPESVDEAIFWRALETFLPRHGADAAKLDVAAKQVKDLWPQVLFNFQDHGDIELLPWDTPV